ncbi:hypothetical protein BH10ACI1_BH10ACI1_01020 [soil metagenome]
MKKKQSKIIFKLALLFVFAIAAAACGRISFSPENINSAQVEPTVEISELERLLKAAETADFNYIYIIRRKDGGAFDKEDRDFLRANRTPEINRWDATEDKKAFVVGSNFQFIPEHWQNLQKRFSIEDHSKPIEVITVETNTNKNAKK